MNWWPLFAREQIKLCYVAMFLLIFLHPLLAASCPSSPNLPTSSLVHSTLGLCPARKPTVHPGCASHSHCARTISAPGPHTLKIPAQSPYTLCVTHSQSTPHNLCSITSHSHCTLTIPALSPHPATVIGVGRSRILRGQNVALAVGARRRHMLKVSV